MLLATSVMWATASVASTASDELILALYRLQMALGGPGFRCLSAFSLQGIAVTGGLSGRLPKWFAILGVLLALIGELSWLFLMTPKALPLIPLVRFPGFPWLIAAAWLFPNTRAVELAPSHH